MYVYKYAIHRASGIYGWLTKVDGRKTAGCSLCFVLNASLGHETSMYKVMCFERDSQIT